MPDKDAYNLREIFEEITLDLLHSLRRTFKLHQLEQEKEGFAWEQWQAAKLRHLATFRRENREIIEGRSKEIEETITNTLDNSFTLGGARAEREILRILFPRDIWPDKPKIATPDDAFFGINEKKFLALKDSVVGDIEKAQQAVLRRMDDIYRQTIFRAEMHMSTGAKTLNQAVDMATKDFLDAGIQCIEYKDGRRVNVASYAEMALRTASQRATLMGEGQQRNKWGVFTVVVSAHASTCDLCLPWQRKVLIDDVYAQGKSTGQYPLLSQAMETGLFHPNCRHLISTYFPGITSLPKPIDEETARKNYEAEQKQRYIERQIRKWKRREAGSLDSLNQEDAAGKVEEWQEKLRGHLDKHPQLRRDYSREKIVGGLSRSEHSGILKQMAESAKIKETRNKILTGQYNLQVRQQKQTEHILGEKRWVKRARETIANGDIPQGGFYKTIDIQKLINQYVGKGVIQFRGKSMFPREYVDVNGIIGRAYSRQHSRYLPTNRIAIHYSKKGVHAYPVLPPKE